MANRVRILESLNKPSGRVLVTGVGYKVQVVQPGTTTAVTVYQAATGGSTWSWFGTDPSQATGTGDVVPFTADPATTGTPVAGGEMWVDEQRLELRVLTLAGVQVLRRPLELVSAATLKSVESRSLRGYLTLASQGCALDGTTDDSAAFAAAITTAANESKELILDGTMKLSSRLLLDPGVPLRLRGDDPATSTILQADYATNHPLIDLGGYSASTTNPQALTGDATAGTRTLVVADGSGYAAGDTLILESDDPWPWSDKGATRGEMVRIASKVGSTLTLREPIYDNYTVALAGGVKKLNMTESFLLEAVTLRNNAPATHANGMLRLRGFRDPIVRHCIVEGPDNRVFMFEHCDGFTAHDLDFRDGNDNATLDRYVYGVDARGVTQHGTVTNLRAKGGMRHVFTTTSGSEIEGIPRSIHVAHGHARGMSNACWDTHPEGELITFEDLHAEQTDAWAFQLRAPNSSAKGCTARDNRGAAFWVRASNISLDGCESRWARGGTIVSTAGDPGADYDGQGLRIGDGPTLLGADDVKVRGMLIEDADDDGAYVGTASDRALLELLTIRRPGRSGSNLNCIRFSGTSAGHRLKGPTLQNASVGIFGVSTITDVQLDGGDFESIGAISGGGIVLGAAGRDNGHQGCIAPSAGGWTAAGLGLTANLAYFVRFVPARTMTVAKLAFGVSTAAAADDACDVGIYDDTLTRLGSAGATTGKLNATGVKTLDLTATVVVKAGKTYYAAFSMGAAGGSAASIRGANFADATATQLFGATAGAAEAFSKTVSHPLPAGPVATPTAGSNVPELAVRES